MVRKRIIAYNLRTTAPRIRISRLPRSSRHFSHALNPPLPNAPMTWGEISSARRRTNLLNVVLRQCLRRNIHSILLHFLAHIGILDYRFPLFRHCILLLSRFLPTAGKLILRSCAELFWGGNEAQIKIPRRVMLVSVNS